MFLLSDCSLTDMADHLRILLILTALTGIHSITTVSKVSVKARGSISIPCLYDSQYINHVKYLCKGNYWSSCSIKVRTDKRISSGKYSISDDKNKRIFTVTIKGLTGGDTGYWWCGVEIKGSDDGAYFHLSVTRGMPSLYVARQEITGYIGEETTINCHNYNSGNIKWCKLGGSCVTSSGWSIDGTWVTIARSTPNVFTVTMSGLRTESSGWYWCDKGDLQMPVYVIVTQKPTTTTIATTTRTTTPTTTQTTTRLTTKSPTSDPVTPTTDFAEKTSPTVQGEHHSTSTDLKNIIIPLSLLIFTVMVALLTWFIFKKQKQTRETSVAMAATPNTESDGDVVYSVVTVRPKNSAQRAEANDENVIYSTLA